LLYELLWLGKNASFSFSFVCRNAKSGSSDTSGFSKFEGKKKRQQTDKVSTVKSIFRKTVQAGEYRVLFR